MYYAFFHMLPVGIEVSIFALMKVYVLLCIFLGVFDMLVIYGGRTRQHDFESGGAVGLFLPFMFFAFFMNIITVIIARHLEGVVTPPGEIINPRTVDITIAAVFALSFFAKLFVINKMNTKPSDMKAGRDGLHLAFYLVLFYLFFLLHNPSYETFARNLIG